MFSLGYLHLISHPFHDGEFTVVIYNAKIMLFINCKDVYFSYMFLIVVPCYTFLSMSYSWKYSISMKWTLSFKEQKIEMYFYILFLGSSRFFMWHCFVLSLLCWLEIKACGTVFYCSFSVGIHVDPVYGLTCE